MISNLAAGVAIGVALISPAWAAPRPNIILLMADDLGRGDLQCFNPSSPIQTPALDEMAGAGMRFDRFYASSPVCSPTRGSCLTGRHPFRYGVYYANTGHLRPEEITLAELLQSEGYKTGHFGKWHLGTMTTEVSDANRGAPGNTRDYSPPWKHGFQVCFSTESKTPTWDPMLKPVRSGGRGSAQGWEPIEQRALATEFGTRYWNERGQVVHDNLEGDDSRVIMDRVVPFVRQAARSQTPFLSVIWFHTPHLPVVAGPQHAAIYEEHSSFKKRYYGCVTAMDEQIGRLRSELASLGITENTMIWFCSDNGPEGNENSPGSAANFRGRKRDLYEGGVRVPGILEWPARVAPGSVTGFPAVTSDYLVTILDVLGLNLPDDRPVDGVSLLPVLTGRPATRQEPIGFQSRRQLAWTTERYKLLSRDLGETWELYDLLSDPAESRNLATEFPEKIEAMSEALAVWISSCKASDEGGDWSK